MLFWEMGDYNGSHASSNHTEMSVTGGLQVEQQVKLGGSEDESSCHASVVSSAILTNSRSSIFFTTLCGKIVVGLYGSFGAASVHVQLL